MEIAMSGMGFEDPLRREEDSVVPGLVHRYPDRALMVLTDICPMLCRHCTRKREWRHGGWVRTDAEIEAMLDYIRRTQDRQGCHHLRRRPADAFHRPPGERSSASYGR